MIILLAIAMAILLFWTGFAIGSSPDKIPVKTYYGLPLCECSSPKEVIPVGLARWAGWCGNCGKDLERRS